MLIFHLANISAISLFVNSCCYCYYCHLLWTILIINLVSLSHTYTCHFSSYHYSSSPKIFLWKSCVTVFYNGEIHHSLFTNLPSIPLICMDIHALLLLSAAPPPGGQPPPASDRGRLPGLCSNYVNIYVNLSMYTLIRSQSSDYLSQDPLPNWLSGVSQPRVQRGMSAITPLYCWLCWLCC